MIVFKDMKKIFLAALALAVMPAAAQDTYESARLLGSDLNGTARYVGMGGAMDALGADISTMSTNPAGIGMFRHSSVSASLGLVSQSDAQKFDGLGKTNVSFDQMGFVYSAQVSPTSFINVGFNYHKSRNFDQILSAANALSNCSQNGLTFHKTADRNLFYLEENEQGDLIGYVDNHRRSLAFSESDYMNANALMLDPNDGLVYYNDARAYSFDRAHRGWISDFDINISGNGGDRFYWGFTVGIKDVNYKGYSEYGESLVDNAGDCGSVVVADNRKIKGTGFDVKAGIIFLPIEESPFRIGLSISTPTFYDLTASNDTYLLNNTPYGAYDEGYSSQAYDFKFYTPWKFGVSMGHTFSNKVALGVGYEYSDWGASKNRINDGSHYDWWSDEYYDDSHTDEPMKQNTERSLTGQHVLKAGAEFKPVPQFAIRVGYNYLSAPYEDNGYRNALLESPGVSYASTTDYVNWKDTHRITCGLGVKAGGFSIDLAYQYSTTKGDFHPFQPYVDVRATGVKEVSNDRHQALLTLGYTF